MCRLAETHCKRTRAYMNQWNIFIFGILLYPCSLTVPAASANWRAAQHLLTPPTDIQTYSNELPIPTVQYHESMMQWAPCHMLGRLATPPSSFRYFGGLSLTPRTATFAATSNRRLSSVIFRNCRHRTDMAAIEIDISHEPVVVKVQHRNSCSIVGWRER